MTNAAEATRPAPRRVFRDRREAGKVLAGLLDGYRDDPDVIVLGLARGGIPVAWEVAAALRAPLDAFIVRKLGVPGHEEFAVGALASGGRIVVNDDVLRGLRITPEQLREIAEREGRELVRREAAYRGGRPPLQVAGKTVILVDDGLATGVKHARGCAGAARIRARADRDRRTRRPGINLPRVRRYRRRSGVRVDAHAVSGCRRVVLGLHARSPTTRCANCWHPDRGATPVRPAAADAPPRWLPTWPSTRRGGMPPREMLEELIGDARIVLIGESSHGTHEFYEARVEHHQVADRATRASAPLPPKRTGPTLTG